MKNLFFAFLLFINSLAGSSQSVSINTDKSAAHATAILDVKSAVKGMLLPRTSTTSRNAIVNPAKGLILYDTTTSGFWFYNGSLWAQLSVGNNSWNLTGNAITNPVSNFIGTTDNQPLRFRVNNIWAGEIHPTSSNVFFGLSAGNISTTGEANTAVGNYSLFGNTDGNFNTATGYYTLSSNTTGYNNTALGTYALTSNIAGGQNTAIGRNALYANTSGSANTAVGVDALLANTTGFNNTASGYRALYSNNGIANTATGWQALYANTTGDQNTAMGEATLSSNTSGSANTAYGQAALSQNLTGSNNTATGLKALYLNTEGDYNTASGTKALYSNRTGNNNTANGYEALTRNTGDENTATGAHALYSNTTGNNNTAHGYLALFSNITGSQNTATGDHALSSNSSGLGNTAEGAYALSGNTQGGSNTAIGSFANNSNTTGDGNTSIGQASLSSNTTGYSNTAVGSGALFNNKGGYKNIAIGAGSGTHPNAPNIFNTVSIGNDDLLNGYQNQVIIGNSSTGFIGGKVTWSVVSDARVKNTIVEDVKGLDFILRLRPVTYHISNKAITTLSGNKETPDFAGKYDGEKVKYTGFLAQEVEQAAKGAGYDFSGYSAPKNKWGLYTLSYEQFVVPLVKAMQEQQVIIENQQNQIDRMEKRLAALESKDNLNRIK